MALRNPVSITASRQARSLFEPNSSRRNAGKPPAWLLANADLRDAA
jgi:hypothetical protein